MRTSRHLQTSVPPEVHRRLHDLAYDTHRSVADLTLDGVLLVLRLHDRGAGLPEPTAPAASTNVSAEKGETDGK